MSTCPGESQARTHRHQPWGHAGHAGHGPRPAARVAHLPQKKKGRPSELAGVSFKTRLLKKGRRGELWKGRSKRTWDRKSERSETACWPPTITCTRLTLRTHLAAPSRSACHGHPPRASMDISANLRRGRRRKNRRSQRRTPPEGEEPWPGPVAHHEDT